MTASADKTVVESLIEDFGTANYPGDDADEIFERYAVTQIVKPMELGADDLEAGIVDGPGDGGIDAFYVFVNGALMDVDSPLLDPGSEAVENLAAKPTLEVVVVQAKNKGSWEEAVWEKLLSSLPQLVSLNAVETTLSSLYNADVVERTAIYRRAVMSLRQKFPRVRFCIAYSALAAEANVTDTIKAKAGQVQAVTESNLTTGAEIEVKHVGVSSLYELSGLDVSSPATLTFQKILEQPNSFIGIATVANYLAFVRNELGILRQEIFDANVRDFEGQNTVNSSILLTLSNKDQTDFWWLNNGVTVLGDDVQKTGESLTVGHPLIVNGLQTTHVIDRAQRDGILADERLNDGIVVRVVNTTDEDIRDSIIAGTNRQTHVPSPALYATQPLQQDIERFLRAHGWYYERRKNRYKNVGKPARQRLSINYLAQALITVKLGQPDVARARPTTALVKRYDELFPDSLDQNAYLAAVEILKGVEDFLRTVVAKAILDEFSNSRFYVTAGYVIRKLRLKDTNDFHFENNWSKLKRPLDSKVLAEVLTTLKAVAGQYSTDHPAVTRDAMFKSAAFRMKYFSALTALK